MNEVLQRVEQLKEAKGITVYRLMKDLNMSQSTYSMWIEKDRVPKTDRLQVIAEYFGVSVDYLLNGTNEQEPIIDHFFYLFLLIIYSYCKNVKNNKPPKH